MNRNRWNYRNIYLKSFRWKTLRSKVIEDSMGYCYCCGLHWQHNDEWLEAHHVSYKNLNTEKEIDDLICVCSLCHDEIHELNKLYKIPLCDAHGIVERIKKRLSEKYHEYYPIFYETVIPSPN